LYPSVDWIIPNAAGGNYDRYGAQSGKTYLPVEISVSVDDSTYYKVGSATWTSGAAATTTYLQAMPPKSTLPLQT
jgi:hypothetical protein